MWIMDQKTLRNILTNWYTKNSHKEVPFAPLVLQNDSSTLFTGSGMQQLVPYLIGEKHPLGTCLWDIQPCIRTQDIEEVGDNRHDTFFEMIGNWSLGNYFKKEQLNNLWHLYTKELGLSKNKLYISVFSGEFGVEKDAESIAIWQEIFAKEGLKCTVGTEDTWNENQRITLYGAKKNWWSRSGTPDKMPEGEIGGPDSEIFFDFGSKYDDGTWGNPHPNSDSGRFIEIGNSVFIQYKKTRNKLIELPQKNVDFGGGFERLLAAIANNPDVFETDVFKPIINTIVNATKLQYIGNEKSLRIIADHIKTATLIVGSALINPSNKEHGYIVRRLLRKAFVEYQQLSKSYITKDLIYSIIQSIFDIYPNYLNHENLLNTQEIINNEHIKFSKTLSQGLKELDKLSSITGSKAFDLYQTYGFPWELTRDVMAKRGIALSEDEYKVEAEKHKNASKTASSGMFKGGLADSSEQVKKYHTATHLLNQALTDIINNDVRQEGSNITGERLRFDFYTSENIETLRSKLINVQTEINKHIEAKLPMRKIELAKEMALTIGAKSFFKEKYPDTVSVYYIGGTDGKPETAYSKEFCGGPHVANTAEIGKLELYKLEKIGSNIYRIYAK